MDAPPHPDAPVSPTDARLSPAQDLAVERVDLSRPAVLEEIVRLCGQALGWAAEDPNRDFFEWKHLANPFGVISVSPDRKRHSVTAKEAT